MRDNGWINIRDRLPVDDSLVLVIMAKFGDIKQASSVYLMYCCIRSDGNRYWEYQGDVSGDAENNPDYWTVVYWQPIPAYPDKQPL